MRVSVIPFASSIARTMTTETTIQAEWGACIVSSLALLAITAVSNQKWQSRHHDPPVKPGITLAQLSGPVIETERLILRPWRGEDIAPNTAMLSDPDTARFITADGKPVDRARTAGATRRSCPGTGLCYGFGMFVVEEKSSGKFVGTGRSVVSADLAGLRGWLGYCQGVSRQGLRAGGGAGDDRLGVFDLRDRSDHPLHRPRKYRVAGRGATARGRNRGRDRVVRTCRGCLGDRAPHVAGASPN